MINYILAILFYISLSLAIQIESNYPLPLNNIKDFYEKVKNEDMLKEALQNTESFEDIELINNKLILKRKLQIKKINIQGNDSFWKREILGIAGIYEGMYISNKDIPSILLKLRQFYINNGFINSIIKVKSSIDSLGNLYINILIKENKRAKIENIKLISDLHLSEDKKKEYKKILNLKNKPLSFSLMEKSFRKLTKFLQDKGYFDAYVYLHSVQKDKNYKYTAILNIVHGTHYRIEIIGNYSFRKSVLEKFHTFSIDGVNIYSVNKFAQKIKKFYRERGFLDADVDFFINDNIKNRETLIKIYVYEGKPYKIANLEASYDTQPPKDIKKIFNSLKGKVYKEIELRKKLQKLINSYQKNGYINSYFVIKHKKEKNNLVNLYIEIFQGKKYLLSKVKFEGYVFKESIDTPTIYNPQLIIDKQLKYQKYLKSLGYFDSRVEFKVDTKLRKNIVEVIVIYKTILGKRYENTVPFVYGTWKLNPKAILWVIKKNGGFDKDEYDNELNILYNSYMFKFLNPSLIKDKKNKKVVKSLSFIEEKRGNIQGSISYNSVEKLKGSLSLSLRNLFNYGFEANSYIELSQIATNYRVSLGSRLLPKKFQSFIGVYSSYQYHRYYDLVSYGSDLNISRNANKWVIQRLKLDISNNKVKPSNDFYKKYSFIFSLSDDHRNNKIYPTRGYYFRGSIGYIGGNLSYPFIDLSNRFYYKIPFTEKVVITQRTSLGFKLENTENLPISERYFIGGIFTIRGFNYEEISNGGIGGNSFLILNNEIRYPILPQYNLYGFSFLDLGNVYANEEDLKSLYLRKTAGTGILVPTPAGSFMLDISTILDRKQNEDKYRIEFSISAIF